MQSISHQDSITGQNPVLVNHKGMKMDRRSFEHLQNLGVRCNAPGGICVLKGKVKKTGIASCYWCGQLTPKDQSHLAAFLGNGGKEKQSPKKRKKRTKKKRTGADNHA